MALMTCPDCGHNVSDAAVACPECGRPVALAQPQATASYDTPVSTPGSQYSTTYLQTCPDCQREVSATALTCPQCGHAFATADTSMCPYCHQLTARKVQGVFGAESLFTFLLLLLGIIPGAIYYFDVTRYPYCANCRKRIRKRITSYR
jgi:hypothetical protein